MKRSHTPNRTFYSFPEQHPLFEQVIFMKPPKLSDMWMRFLEIEEKLRKAFEKNYATITPCMRGVPIKTKLYYGKEDKMQWERFIEMFGDKLHYVPLVTILEAFHYFISDPTKAKMKSKHTINMAMREEPEE